MARILMRKKLMFAVALGIALMPSLSSAQETGAAESIGTSVANFLKIGVGARAMGMSGAYVALADEASGLYWNPGALPFSSGNQFIIQQNQWLVESNLYFVGTTYRLFPQVVLGASMYYFSSGLMEETTLQKPEGTGREFDANDIAFGLTYSQKITNRFSTGATVKYIRETLDTETSSTVAFDIGSIFVTNFFNEMRIGMSLSNLGGKMQLAGSGLSVDYQSDPDANTKVVNANLNTEAYEIPLYFRFGVATDLYKRRDELRWTMAVEAMDSRDFTHRISLGTEIAIMERYFLRTGYKFNSEEEDWAVGAGARFWLSGMKLNLGYTYQNYGHFDGVQFFTFTFEY